MNWVVHIILLILGEIWSKRSNLTSLLVVDIFVKIAKVNAKALNIKSYQLQQGHCRGSAKAKSIFIKLPQHFIWCDKKCWNLRAALKVHITIFVMAMALVWIEHGCIEIGSIGTLWYFWPWSKGNQKFPARQSYMMDNHMVQRLYKKGCWKDKQIC